MKKYLIRKFISYNQSDPWENIEETEYFELAVKKCKELVGCKNPHIDARSQMIGDKEYIAIYFGHPKKGVHWTCCIEIV